MNKKKRLILIAVITATCIFVTLLIHSNNIIKEEDKNFSNNKQIDTIQPEETAETETEEEHCIEDETIDPGKMIPVSTESITFQVDYDNYLSAVNQYFAIDNKYTQIPNVDNFDNNVADCTEIYEMYDGDEKFNGLIYMTANTTILNTFVNNMGVTLEGGDERDITCYGTLDENYNLTIHYLAIGNVSNAGGYGELLIDDGFVTKEMMKQIIKSDIGWNVYS